MRPVPQRGTGGARGGLNFIRKKVFYRAVFFIILFILENIFLMMVWKLNVPLKQITVCRT
jgi:hypothetical protein